jgi:hypothetical protein
VCLSTVLKINVHTCWNPHSKWFYKYVQEKKSIIVSPQYVAAGPSLFVVSRNALHANPFLD